MRPLVQFFEQLSNMLLLALDACVFLCTFFGEFPSATFMLTNSSSRFTTPIIIKGMMTVCDDSVLDYGKTTFFDDDTEVSLL